MIITAEGWFARDKDGGLFLHTKKPHRDFIKGLDNNADVPEFWVSDLGTIGVPDELYPELIWENEPMPVKITIEDGVKLTSEEL